MTMSWKRNLYALWIAQTLTIVGFSLRAPFLPFYIEQLGAQSFARQALWAGVINSGGAAVMAISSPLWGIAADRYGCKPMVVRAMVAGSFTIGLMSLARSPWRLLILRFIEGGFTGTVTASTTLVAATTPRERLGFGLGMMQDGCVLRRVGRAAARRTAGRPDRLPAHVHRGWFVAVHLGHHRGAAGA